jgi:hypothetical protein
MEVNVQLQASAAVLPAKEPPVCTEYEAVAGGGWVGGRAGLGVLDIYHQVYYSLRARPSRDRIPVRARFFAPDHTGSGAHPACCTMGAGSFPGIKQPGRAVSHPPLSSAEVKEGVQLYLYSPFGPSWHVIG